MEAATVQRLSPVGAIPTRLRSDGSLVRAAAAGERAAFEAIFRRYQQPLYRYCCSLLGSEADAADALQNTMVATLRALPGERREIDLKPWLYRIAHNEAISLIRRRRPQEQLDERSAGTGGDPAAKSEARGEFRQLIADLGELSEAQRSALVLRELSGLSYEEIAQVFGISLAATKQSIHKARLALQEIAEGRAMACEQIQRTLSERDGRLLKGRGIRAHLKSCSRCEDYRTAISRRQATLQAHVPLLAAPAAAKMIAGALGGGSHGGSGGGLAAMLGGGKLAGSSVAVKAIAVGAATVAVGAGGVGLTAGIDGGRQSSSAISATGHAEWPDAALEATSRAATADAMSADRRDDLKRSESGAAKEQRAGGSGGNQEPPEPQTAAPASAGAPPAPPQIPTQAATPPVPTSPGSGASPPGSSQTGADHSTGQAQEPPAPPPQSTPPTSDLPLPEAPVSPPTPPTGGGAPTGLPSVP